MKVIAFTIMFFSSACVFAKDVWVSIDAAPVNGSIEADVRAQASQVTNLTVQDYDDSRLGWDIAVGYHVAEQWSLAFGWQDLGEVEVSYLVETTDPSASAQQLTGLRPLSAKGPYISVNFHQQYGRSSPALKASLGVWVWEGDYNVSIDGVRFNTERMYSTDIFLELEMQHAFDDNLSATAGLRIVGDRDVAKPFPSLGLVRSF